MALPYMTAEEAAELIQNGDVLGLGGFTATGVPKAVPFALAARAERLHAEGKPFRVGLETGASMGDSCDGALARAHAVDFRTPYQSNKSMRDEINAEGARYFDMHLSHMAQDLRYGFLPRPKWAIIEASYVGEDGVIIPAAGVGIMPTICRLADKIIVEVNEMFPVTMRGMHDLYEPLDPPYRKEIPIYKPSDRCGSDHIKVDPAKIAAVVKTNRPNEIAPFTPVDATTAKIGENVALFLEKEMHAGRIPKTFLPIQSGVGNVANAVLGELGKNPHIPPFEMYSEVVQDSVVDLITAGHCKFASGCSLRLVESKMAEVLSNLDYFHDKMLLRPQETSNNPEIIRRLGLIAINTALEADIYGNVNSTHVCGTKMMNGIGGSGDFARNAYLSIFTTASTAKNGAISSIVPMVTHLDHSEHSVKVIVTEQGVADLRGKSPRERAEEIIANCVAPEYKEMLRDYVRFAKHGQTPHTLSCALAMHEEFLKSGDMRNTKWENYLR